MEDDMEQLIGAVLGSNIEQPIGVVLGRSEMEQLSERLCERAVAVIVGAEELKQKSRQRKRKKEKKGPTGGAERNDLMRVSVFY